MHTPAFEQKNLKVTGDVPTLFAARAEVRKNFEQNRNLSAGSEEYTKQIAHAEEVAQFLRQNVVQGQASQGDKYSMYRVGYKQ
jgi:complex III assembly factor LYRM7